jgi:hypothetical protein
MAKALVLHAFADRANEVIAESIDLFYALHEREHSANVRKHMDAILAVKPHAFECDNNFNVNLTGNRFSVGSRRISDYWRAEASSRPVLHGVDMYPGIGISADDALHDRLLAFFDSEAQLKADAQKAHGEALATLSQFRTVKSLRDSWPEVLSVVENLLPEDNLLLPVVQVKHLNDRFGLPATV